MLKPISLVLTLASMAIATEAQAQHFLRRGHASKPAAVASPSVGVASTTPLVPYSYYTLSSRPARTYVGYGADEFPFLGSPYGHPYDPWTWPMMSGYYTSGLARYYQPPVK